MFDINNLSAEQLIQRAKEIEIEVKPKAEQWSKAVRTLLEQSEKEFEPARQEVEAIYERYSELRLIRLQTLLGEKGLYWDSAYNDLSPVRDDVGLFFLSPSTGVWHKEYTSPSRLSEEGKKGTRRFVNGYGDTGEMPIPVAVLPQLGGYDRIYYQATHSIPKELEKAFPAIGKKVKLSCTTSVTYLPCYRYHSIWNDSSYEELRAGKELLFSVA